MAIAFVSQGTTPTASVANITGTTSVTPALPASLANGNIVLIYVGCKYDTASVGTPTGWTLAGSVAGGGTGTGNDSGPTRTTVFYRIKDASWSTMPTITVTSGNSAFAQAFQYSNASGIWDVASSGGTDTAGGTSWSVTTAANPGITAGDLCFVASTVPTDVGAGATFSAQAISATGISAWGTLTERSEPYTAQGNDSGGMVFERPVTTGTSSAAPVITATAGGTTTNILGTSLLVRLREIVLTPKSATDGAAITATDARASASPLVMPVSSGSSPAPIRTFDFETSLTPWLTTAGLIQRVSGGQSGSWEMRHTTSGSIATAYYSSGSLNDVTEGDTITVGVWAKYISGTAQSYQFNVDWYNSNSGGEFLYSENLISGSVNTGSWQYFENSIVVPTGDGISKIGLSFQALNNTSTVTAFDDVTIVGNSPNTTVVDSAAISVADASAIGGGITSKSASDTAAISVSTFVEQSAILTAASNLNDDFDSAVPDGVFSRITGDGTLPYTSGGKLILPFEAAVGSSKNAGTGNRYYTLDSTGVTVEVSKWPNLAFGMDDFSLDINAWQIVSVRFNGTSWTIYTGPSTNSGLDPTTVKYINWRIDAGPTMNIRFYNAAGTQLGGPSGWGTGFWNQDVGMSFVTQYSPTGVVDTWEIERVFYGPPPVTTSKSGTESTAITVTETSAVAKSSSTTDTAAISVAESRTLAGSSTSTETNSLTITEAKTLAGSSTSTDGAAISVSDTSSVSSSGGSANVSGAETPSISVAETSRVEITTTTVTIVNGDFETGLTTGWNTPIGTNTTVTVGTTNVGSGTYALQLNRATIGANDTNAATSNFFPVTPGKFYKAAAKVSGRGNATMEIRWFNSSYSHIASTPSYVPDYSGGGLVSIVRTGKAPTGAAYGQIHTNGVSMLAGTGTYESISQVDDVSVTELSYAGMQTVFDDFYGGNTDVNGRQVQIGGQNWVGSNMVINDHTLAKGAPAGGGSAIVDTGMYDGTITFDFHVGANTSDYTGISIRMANTQNYIKLEQDGSKFEMKKIVGNTETQLQTGFGVFAANTTYAMKIVMSGASITTFVNNVQIHSYTITDAALLTGTNARLYVNYYTDYWFDNFMMFGPGPTTVSENFTNGIPADVVKGTNVTLNTDVGNPLPSITNSGGSEGWWYFTDPKWTAADFDFTTDVFLSSGTREILNIGFWMTSPGSTADGYMYRIDSGTGGSMGYYTVAGGVHSGSRVSSSSNGFFDVNWATSNKWYRVRMVGNSSIGVVTTTITDLSNGSVWATDTATLPAGNRSGTFGRKQDGLAGPGSMMDNIVLVEPGNAGAESTAITVTETSSMTVLMGATRVEDDFTGPDGTDNVFKWQGPARKTPIGSKTWTQNPSTAADGGINNNRMYFGGWTFMSVDVDTPEVIAEVDYTVGSSIGEGGLMVRGNNADMTTSVQIRTSTLVGGSWYFQKTVNGGSTNIGFFGSVVPNTTYRIKIVSRGSYIGVSIDGVPIANINVTEPELLTGTRVGIFNYSNGNYFFDNFKVTALTGQGTDNTSVSAADASSRTISISATDTAAITVTEGAPAITAGKTATDTAAITITEARTLASSLSRTDTAAITITEGTSAITAGKTATDGAAITITDASTMVKNIASTDTASIAVTDISNITSTVPGTDSAAIAVTDTSSITVTLASTDTAAISVLDDDTNNLTLSRTDTAAISVADTSALQRGFTSTDTAAITVTETASVANTQATTDTAAISVAEASSISSVVTASDTTAITVTETASITVTVNTTDTGAISVAESTFGVITASASETVQISIADASSSVINTTKTATDTAAISVAEVAAVVVSVQRTDTAAISVAETTASALTVSTTDTSSIAVNDISNIASSTPATESVAIAVTEQASIAVVLSSTDAAAISVADTSASAITRSTTDTAAITVTETASIAVTFSTTDTASLAVSEASASALSLSRTDTTAISIAETTSGAITGFATDTAAISVADTSALAITAYLSASDSLGIGVVDTSTLFKAIASTDTASIAVSETTHTALDKTATDTAAISILDSSTLASTAPGVESVALTVTETASIAVTLSSTDTGAVSVSDTSSLYADVTKTASESNSLAVADTAAVAVSLSSSETNSLAVSETSTLFKAIVASDSGALAITETSNIASNSPGDESLALGVTETSSVFVSLATSDTSALVVSETYSSSVTVSTTDTSAISVTESTHTMKTLSATDTASIAVNDLSASIVNAPGTESNSISVIETASIYATVTTNDTSSLSVSEATAFTQTRYVTASDTGSLAVSETSAPAVSLSTTDTAAVAVSETWTSFRAIGGVDTCEVGCTEVGNAAPQAPTTDPNAIGVVEDSDILVTSSTVDSTAIFLSETASIFITSSTSDTAGIAVSETASAYGTFASTDTGSVAVAETSAVSGTVTSTDTGALSVSETANIHYAPPGMDSAAISVAETSQVVISGSTNVSASDSAALSVTETTALTIGKTATESTAISVAETATVSSSVTSSDTLSLAVTDTGALVVSATSTDTSALVVSEQSSFGQASQAGTDTAYITVNDTSFLAVKVDVPGTDATFLTITESSSIAILGVVAKSATDTAALAVSETAVNAVFISRTDTIPLAVLETKAFEDSAFTRTETIALSVSDVAHVFKNVSASDGAALSVSDSGVVQQSLGFLEKTANDTIPLHVNEYAKRKNMSGKSDHIHFEVNNVRGTIVESDIRRGASVTSGSKTGVSVSTGRRRSGQID